MWRISYQHVCIRIPGLESSQFYCMGIRFLLSTSYRVYIYRSTTTKGQCSTRLLESNENDLRRNESTNCNKCISLASHILHRMSFSHDIRIRQALTLSAWEYTNIVPLATNTLHIKCSHPLCVPNVPISHFVAFVAKVPNAGNFHNIDSSGARKTRNERMANTFKWYQKMCDECMCTMYADGGKRLLLAKKGIQYDCSYWTDYSYNSHHSFIVSISIQWFSKRFHLCVCASCIHGSWIVGHLDCAVMNVSYCECGNCVRV